MKKILFVTTALLTLSALIPAAQAAPISANARERIILTKAKRELTQRKLSLQQAKLVDFFVSPAQPKAGDSVVVFAKANTRYTDQTLLIEGLFDTVPVTLSKPASQLWVFEAGKFTERRDHLFTAKIFLENTARAGEIRTAITTLEQEITALNEEIALATDPGVIADLTAARDQKAALKNELILALADLKLAVAEESIAFSIGANDSDLTYPKILSVAPNVIRTNTASNLQITGQNFAAAPEVKINGVTVSSTYVSSTRIDLTSVSLAQEGAKKVDVRITNGGEVKNAILENAFFVSGQPLNLPQPTPPVAIAKAFEPSIAFGAAAQFSNAGSYDANGQTFRNEWRLIAKPTGSALAIGSTVVGTGSTYSFTPDAPGSYVMELKVITTSGPVETSEPSLAVVTVAEPTNRAPTLSGGSLTLGNNGTRTLALNPADLDTWQTKSLFVTKQGTLGTATISSGILTYVAGSSVGSDSVVVTVVDNGVPQASASVTIPVSIVSNLPPTFASLGMGSSMRTSGFPVSAVLSTFDVASDPDGSIAECKWEVLGVVVKGDTAAGFCDANIDVYQTGTFPATLTITDNRGVSTSQTSTLTFGNVEMPDGKFTANPVQGSAPLTVNFNATVGAIPGGGTPARFRYRYGDGSPTVLGATQTKTYNNPGTYNVQVRTNGFFGGGYDSSTFINTKIYVGAVLPPFGTEPISQARFPGGREVVVSNPISFDGSISFDPQASASIASYSWNFGDIVTCPAGNCTVSGAMQTYTYPQVGTYFPRLTVTDNAGGTGTSFHNVYIVNTGHAPRIALKQTTLSGVAPYTANIGVNFAYDYDAPINRYMFNHGASGGTFVTVGDTASHTYSTPGVYFANYRVYDSDENFASASVTVTVLPSTLKASPAKKIRRAFEPGDGDPREEQRSLLAGACAQGSGFACHDLAQMFAEDGDAYTAEKLHERACTLGHLPSCEMR